MIDTVELTWGWAIEPASRRVDRPGRGTSTPTRREPVRLDMTDLIERLGTKEGEVQHRLYGDSGQEFAQAYGHWQVGDVGVLYRDGRLQLRGSLPKIVTGTNDALLDERGVHYGLRKLTKIGGELTGANLQLEEAIPTRLDYVYQWDVPSVAFVLEHMRANFAPSRKLRTENVSHVFGGRSIVWGYGSRRALRFYDKGAECAEKAYHAGERELTGLTRDELARMEPEARTRLIVNARRRAREQAIRGNNVLGYDLDTRLRYEVQERIRPRLWRIHEDGYRAAAIRAELQERVAMLATVACRDIDALIEAQGRNGFATVMAGLYLAEHDEMWPVARRHLDRSTVWRWRQRAREFSLAVGEWQPRIPDDAFDAGPALWAEPLTAVA